MCTCIYCVLYCFVYVYLFLLVLLYLCKDYCHRVTTQLQLVVVVIIIMRFEVLEAVTKNIIIFMNVTPYILVDKHQICGGRTAN